MKEQVLHFIWEHQYFKITKAVTLEGLPIQVIKPGKPHINSGPDFEQAKLFIGDVEWNGDVEIHVNSSAWNTHKHQLDRAYNKVVLHVVWVDDKPVFRQDGTRLPTLVLAPLVDKSILLKTENLLNTIEPIPCATQLPSVENIIITNEINRAFVKRLERKANVITKELINTKGNWEEVAYQSLMRQMGMKINSEAFYELALIIPYSLIRKYTKSVFKLEALLFGASGLLGMNSKDEYVLKLKNEYDFLVHKHKMYRGMSLEQWKFLRLRPANFPTLRLAQAAALLADASSLFALFIENSDTIKLTNFKVSEYWETHYRFGVLAKKKMPTFGHASLDLLLINVVAPLLTAYGKSIDEPLYVEKALNLLSGLKPEKNKIISKWEEFIPKAVNAGETQGLIELYNENCRSKKCLSCGIGFNLIKQ